MGAHFPLYFTTGTNVEEVINIKQIEDYTSENQIGFEIYFNEAEDFMSYSPSEGELTILANEDQAGVYEVDVELSAGALSWVGTMLVTITHFEQITPQTTVSDDSEDESPKTNQGN